MNSLKIEKTFALMKQFGVEYLKTSEVEIKMSSQVKTIIPEKISSLNPVDSSQIGSDTSASAPPVQMEIPHHENEVSKLLKLNDEELVDALFPEGALINAQG